MEAERERTTSVSPSSNSLQRFAPSSSHPSFANSSHLRSRRERCPLRSRPLPRTLPPRLARDSLHRPRIDAADVPSRAPHPPQVQRKLAQAADKTVPAWNGRVRLGNLRTWTAGAVAHRPALSRTLFQAPAVDGANLKSYWPTAGRRCSYRSDRAGTDCCQHDTLRAPAPPSTQIPSACDPSRELGVAPSTARCCRRCTPIHSRTPQRGLIASALPPRRRPGRTRSRRTQSASCGLARLPRHATLRTRACTHSFARPQMTAYLAHGGPRLDPGRLMRSSTLPLRSPSYR